MERFINIKTGQEYITPSWEEIRMQNNAIMQENEEIRKRNQERMEELKVSKLKYPELEFPLVSLQERLRVNKEDYNNIYHEKCLK